MLAVRGLPLLIHLILIPVLDGYFFFPIGISGKIEVRSWEVTYLRFSS